MEEHIIWVVGGFISLLLTLIGVLLARSIGHVDETIKGLVAQMEKVTLDLAKGDQLRDFQDRRIARLEHEKEVLNESFYQMDMLIRNKFDLTVPRRTVPE